MRKNMNLRRTAQKRIQITRNQKKATAILMATALVGLSLSACGSASTAQASTTEVSTEASTEAETETETEKISYDNAEAGGHAILADGEEATYDNITVTKTGDSSSNDEADFYGDNAAIFAENGATLTIANADVTTDGAHANAVFSYGEGTTVNISDSTITTNSNNSGGLMTTGGGTMNAKNLTIITQGGSSAAIRSDRGGGTVTVDGGYYETNGSGSPDIYSTADITVKNATLVSNSAQGIVVEGSNSATLENTDVTANNVSKNSDNSDYYQAVMIYQSMSGDAEEGTAAFKMTGGSLTSKNGGMFFVNNTTATIELEDVAFSYASDDFLRIQAAGWGNEGSNGGQVTFTATNQKMEGNTIVDDISTLNMYLKDGSTYFGAINTDGTSGSVYVELTDGSKWTLTGDSYITSLTCDADSIDLNGYKLYVNGTEYTEGTASTGEAVEAYVNPNASTQQQGNPPEMPDGQAPQGGQAPSGSGQVQAPSGNGQAPSGTPGQAPADGETPPALPDGQAPAAGETPPAKPDGEAPQGNPPEIPGTTTETTASAG